MAFNLSSALIDEFVKVTKDDKEIKTESTHYGTIVDYDGKHYVKIDGSDQLTPIPTTTTNVKDGERVRITIKDHVLTVTGNVSNPSATDSDVKDVEEKVEDVSDQITEFEILVSDKVVAEDIEAINGYFDRIKSKVGEFTEMEAVMARIYELEATYANLDHVTANDIKALNAEIENLQATFGKFTHITTEDIEAINGEFDNLKSYNAKFTYVSAEVLQAMTADIKELNTNKLSANEAELKYANIDFSNIGEAAVEKIFSESGIIKDLIVEEGKITGELVGVTIKGDLIEGNTIKADKLVVKGSDGIYYKLNFEGGTFKEGEAVPTDGLHGSVIVAKSITAEKVAVTDLVAFGATIGGFKIGQNSLYSGVKSDVDNTTRGVYLDNNGQVSFGDTNNFIKFYEDEDGTYKLAISASKISFSASNKSIEDTIKDVQKDAIKATYRYYLLQPSTAEIPSKPTIWPPSAEGPLFTNLVESAIDDNGNIYNETGYKDDYRWSSSAGAEVSYGGARITGWIPFTSGATYRIRNLDMDTKGYVGYGYFIAKKHDGTITTTGIDGTSAFNYTYDSNTDTCSITYTSSAVAHFRISAFKGADLPIITCNEEIAYGVQPNEWDDTEPSYEEESANNLYVVDCTVFADDSYSYSDVYLSSSYEAAKSANAAHKGLVEVSGSIDGKVQDAKDEISKNLNENYYGKEDIDGRFQGVSSEIESAKGSLSAAMNARADELNNLVEATNGRVTQLEDGIIIDPEKATITIKHPSSQIGIVFSTDKISFMQSGYEVAYISSSKLFIEDSEFVDEVRIGNFAFTKRDNGSIDFKKVR